MEKEIDKAVVTIMAYEDYYIDETAKTYSVSFADKQLRSFWKEDYRNDSLCRDAAFKWLIDRIVKSKVTDPLFD